METDQPPSSTSSSSNEAAPLAKTVRSRMRWHVGFLLPRVLVAFAVLDALFRFAPSGWRPMDQGETSVRRRVYGEAYVRNLHSQAPKIYGDLAWIGNLKKLREYRSMSFTTDELGFRNRRRPRSAAALVFG